MKYFLILSTLLFSFSLMFHTFSYDKSLQSVTIATKAWSDFGAHMPLIRSFSHGPNLTRLFTQNPIESPLFPNEPIRYHFGFYALVGLLEKLGVRTDWAVNIPSALGMTLFLSMVYLLSFQLFERHAVSVLSIMFVLFNGSLSFLRFFQIHPLSLTTPIDIITNTKFSSFGPWDGSLVSAFWTLNIYTNQRHLSLAYGLSLFIIFMTRKKTKSIYIALMMSMLLYVHFPAAIMTAIFLAWIFITKKDTRIFLIVSALLSLPAFLFLLTKTHVGSPLSLEYGYLIQKPITVFSFLLYWLNNIGLHILFIPIGLTLAPRRVRRVLAVPLFVIFLLPNIIRLSPDMINNHKFFNFFMIIAGMCSAYAIVRLWSSRIGKCIAIAAVFVLTFSGIIDLFPILNDTRGTIADMAKQQDILFFQTHTNPNDVIANSIWFYHPASLAGRAIYSGYTYFTWSYGYDQDAREQTLLSIYQAKNISTLCPILEKTAISYIELKDNPEDYIKPNLSLWDALPVAYTNALSGIRVYKTKNICEKI